MSRRRKHQATAPTAAEFDAKGAEIRARLTRAVEDFKAYQNENMVPSTERKRTWSTPGTVEREYPRFTREEALAKARQFVEEQPIVASLVSGLADSVAGSGLGLSSLCTDTVLKKEVEARWAERKDVLDIRGIRTWGQLNRCWYTRRIVDGDVGLYKFSDVSGKTTTRSIATIEADRIRWQKFDWLDTGGDLASPGAWKPVDKRGKNTVAVQQGIAYDDNGRMIGAFVGPRPQNQMDFEAMLAEGRWIPSSEFILYAHFSGERVDSIRGITTLMPNFNLYLDLSEVLKNVIQKIKNEAFVALAFMMETTFSGNAGLTPDDPTAKQPSATSKKPPAIPMRPGMNLNLRPGEKVDLLGMKSPNSELMPFIRFLMRIAGARHGFPLELLLLDVSETNFSGGRLLLELAKRRQRVEQDGLARVCSDVFRWDLQGAINDGEIKPPKSAAASIFRHRWSRPSMPYFDPGREAQANGMNLDRLLVAPQDIIADMGEQDEDDILDKWAAWKAACELRGLPVIFGQASTQVEAADDGEGKPQKGKE